MEVHLTEEASVNSTVKSAGFLFGVFFFLLVLFWFFDPASKEQEDISLLTDFIKTLVVSSMFPQIRRQPGVLAGSFREMVS